MSVGLLAQLDEYYSQIDETQNPLSLDEIVEHRSRKEHVQLVGPVAPPVEPRPRRWRPIAVAVAAVVVLVGGMVLFFQVTEPETPVVGTVVPSTLTESNPTTVAESDLTSARWCEAPSTWTRVCDDAAGFEGAVLSSVTAWGPGFVAVGSAGVFDEDEEDDAAVWTSPDGFTWSRVYPIRVFGYGRFSVGEGDSSVTAGGPGLVAVGAADDDAAVLTSPDGLIWSRVPHEEAVFGGAGEQQMLSVTVGGPGLVAVGVAHDDAAVWTSPDGLTWSRVPHEEAVFGGDSDQEMLSVTVGGPGLVAVGSDGINAGALASCCDDGESDAVAAVWTSPDGFTWSRVPHDESIFGVDDVQQMMSVTAGGPGLVAVGAADGDAAVWTSPDGFTWSRVPHDPEAFGGSAGRFSQAWMASVVAGGPGLVAVGSSGEVQGLIEEAVWTSPDGITWTRLPQSQHGCYAEMWSVTNGISGLVAVGFAQGCGPDTAVIWHD